MNINSKSGLPYVCPKCSHPDWQTGQVRVAGGWWSSIFDLETRRFTSISCNRCSYTELYKTEASNLSGVVDLFLT
jgi:predicted nucleic-acid-binding Zn-ribbon protein